MPVLDVTPQDGVLRYDEGIHIGYRAWLRTDAEPAFPFGSGTGYTTWELGTATAAGSADGFVVTVPVANTGGRAGKQVVQVYAERGQSAVERPVRWLVGFAVVRAGAGETVEAGIPVTARSLSYWADGWQLEPGEYTLRVGTSVVDLPQSVAVRVD
ncbi:fibronectin type III-like domain-contianing protein [Schumannella luteola]